MAIVSVTLTILLLAVIPANEDHSYLTGYIKLIKDYEETNAEEERIRNTYCHDRNEHPFCQGN